MEFTSIIILAAAIVCFIGIAIYLRSGKGRGAASEGKSIEEKTGMNPRDYGMDSENGPQGAHALHIPAGMLGDRRNAFIHGRVEEAVKGFQMEEGDEAAFIYIYAEEKSGWVCPYCEGENKEESPICMICGRRPDSGEE